MSRRSRCAPSPSRSDDTWTSRSRSVDPSHFAAFPFAGMDVVVSNESTRELLGWTPTGPTLLEDLDKGHYFA